MIRYRGSKNIVPATNGFYYTNYTRRVPLTLAYLKHVFTTNTPKETKLTTLLSLTTGRLLSNFKTNGKTNSARDGSPRAQRIYLTFRHGPWNVDRSLSPYYTLWRLRIRARTTMGQTVGRMPNTWNGLLEEKDRVLYWSGEVLARVADNVNEEDSLVIEYGNESIDKKIDSWMESNQARIDRIFSKHPDLPEDYKTDVMNGLAQIREAFRIKMRNDYCHGYKNIKKFTKRVDELGERQRKIHGKIQNLESICDGNVKKFKKKFGPLRVKTFKNLRVGEKMMFQDRRLKTQFSKRVYDIDHKNVEECAKCVDKLIKIIEKTAPK